MQFSLDGKDTIDIDTACLVGANLLTTETGTPEPPFDKDTPINDVSNYMREILEMKNMPKKRKMSLGQGYKILQIYNGIKSSGEMDGNEKYEYNEQLISREMKRRFGETLSMEAVAKSLQRIKEIQKEINTLPTNNSNQSVLY